MNWGNYAHKIASFTFWKKQRTRGSFTKLHQKAAHFFQLHGLNKELQDQYLSVNEVKVNYYLSHARVYETGIQADKDN